MPSKRESWSFFVSVTVHASVVLWGTLSFGPSFDLPDLEIEFTEVEMLDPDMLQGEEPPPEPVEERVVAPSEPPDPGASEEEAKPEEQAKPFAEKSSKVDKLGPTNSTFYMLMATKRVAKLPLAAEAIEIMAPLPDFQYLIQGGGFHPLRDFDHLVIASPDIRDMTQTFLAVDYKVSREELKAGVDRAVKNAKEVIEWEERGGLMMGNPKPANPKRPDVDPRWFVLLEDKVAIYVREEFLPNVVAGPAGDEKKTAGNYVANLAKLKRFAAREPRAGLQLKMKDLRRAVRATNLPFPLPNDIEVTAEAATAPEIAIKLFFASVVDAKAGEKFWNEDIAAYFDDNLAAKIAYGWIYKMLAPERDQKQLIFRGKFATEQAKTVLTLLAGQSRKMLRKSPEEMAADRKQREESWKRRKRGRLPPSAAIDQAEPGLTPGGQAPAQGGDPTAPPSGSKPTPKQESPSPAKPEKPPERDDEPPPEP